MPKVVVISGNRLKMFGLLAVIVLLCAAYYYVNQSVMVSGSVEEPREFHMVTSEFKTVTQDGKEIETYRWDPGTIVVKKGELVKLNIIGVNGESHPFVIEGLDIRDEVKKGQTTEVTFRANEAGTHRIICLTHHDLEQKGPMVGYIVVVD